AALANGQRAGSSQRTGLGYCHALHHRVGQAAVLSYAPGYYGAGARAGPVYLHRVCSIATYNGAAHYAPAYLGGGAAAGRVAVHRIEPAHRGVASDGRGAFGLSHGDV
nr:hypothetical protein [Tanacetum cinerariifolium]